MRFASFLVFASLACLAFVTNVAQAESKEGAQLFEEGRELSKMGKYNEACEKFAKSYELDPAVGTQVNYADCQERLGHLARAWQLFDLSAGASDREGNAVRAQYARERANVLLPRLATVVVKARAADVARLRITIAGRDYQAAAEIRAYVDPGDVEVVAESPTNRFAKTLATKAGAQSDVSLPALVAASDELPRKRSTGWVIASAALGVVGIAGISYSGLLTLSASRQYNDAFSQGLCNHSVRGAECTQEGLDQVHEASDRADLATKLFIAGSVLTAGAIVVYVVAPKQEYEIKPIAGPREAGVVFSGRF